jgi:hypothetical protein
MAISINLECPIARAIYLQYIFSATPFISYMVPVPQKTPLENAINK